MSKIVKLEASNFKVLKAVEITPDGNLVVISGRNGQGKSSVLDAITAALGGTSTKTLPRPIRDGEDKAQIILELEDIIVTRTFSGGTTKVVVKSKDGAVFGKGQAKLDALLGKLSLDPLAFTQLSDRDQLATLLGLVELPFNPAELDAERAVIFNHRADLNRRVKDLQGQLAGFDVSNDAPTEEVSVSALLTQYREGQDLNEKIASADRAVVTLKEKVARLTRELSEAQESLDNASDYSAKAPAAVDLEVIQKQIDNAESINAAARNYRAAKDVESKLSAATSNTAELTAQLAAIDKRKADGLATATFPVDGLGFDEDGVTYQGVPFKQASSAEQLRVSLAMAIALKPELRVIRIADGSLLDASNLKLIEQMAVDNDYQVWIEMVSDTGEFGVVIEDGEVA